MGFFFSKFFAIIKLIWNTLLGQLVVAAAVDIVESVGRDAADDLMAIAEAKVQEVEAKYADKPGSGEKKRKEVFDYVADYAAAKGIEIGASIVNFLIETTLASLKAIQ
jgi:hypothetical protein